MEGVRANDPDRNSTLILAGIQEFLPPEGSFRLPEEKFAPSFVKAYEMMGYDRVYARPDELDWLKANKADPAESVYKAVGDMPQSEIITRAGHKIGVIVFPLLPKEVRTPSPELITALRQEAELLRPQVDLLIAVSPWGRKGEGVFLENAGTVFDILLGGGPGSGNTGLQNIPGNTLWVRGYYEGKALNVIRIYSWPEPENKKQWSLGESMRVENLQLHDQIADHPGVKLLF